MIYRVTSYDLMQTAIKAGNYYMCTDIRKMFHDTTNNNRQELPVTFIPKESDRINTIRPSNNVWYYVWDTNSLWYYNAGWTVIDGNGARSSAYYYADNRNITPTDDVIVIDNNGLLSDGSVVVRDFNRVIKGQLYINETTEDATEDTDEGSITVKKVAANELVISSFLNAGIKLLPNGTMDSAGTLTLRMEPVSNTGRLEFYGNMYTTGDGKKFNRLGCLRDKPTDSSVTGMTGDYAFDDNYMYVCISTNYWKRIELESF